MATARPAGRQIGFKEFLFLVSAMMACQALAIDAMLPALTTIAQSLGLTHASRVQLVVFSYVAGMGCGQLAWGLLSDRFGRRRILLIGLGAYAVAAGACGLTHSFTALLVLRFVHGAAAACLVVSRSMIRDLYSGEPMARVMSLTFMVFLISPVIAPSLGQAMLAFAPWRGLFVMVGGFAGLVWVWMLLRLPETLHPEFRLPLDPAHIRHALFLVLGDRAAMSYTLATACIIGALLAYVGTVQQTFAQIYLRPAIMPAAFALSAGAMGLASYFNSRMVRRLGMRLISHAGLLLLVAIACVHTLVAELGFDSLPVFILLQSLVLACIGLTVANFGTLAMESMGPVAGLAASLQGFISSIGAALLATWVGQEFNATTLPLALGTTLCGLGALGCVLWAEKGRLFRGRQPETAGGAAEASPGHA
jgi:DHA1 family bicyclomycin/chloramphenicol resistance-like MFS transporter